MEDRLVAFVHFRRGTPADMTNDTCICDYKLVRQTESKMLIYKTHHFLIIREGMDSNASRQNIFHGVLTCFMKYKYAGVKRRGS